jgi:hypothetical protein
LNGMCLDRREVSRLGIAPGISTHGGRAPPQGEGAHERRRPGEAGRGKQRRVADREAPPPLRWRVGSGRSERASAALDSFLQGGGEPEQRLSAMIDAWFAHVERHPDSSRILFQDATGDPDIEALQHELRRQRAADVALLREFAPRLPEQELEPLGEIIRSSLTGLGLWWLDDPGVPWPRYCV